MLFPSGGQIAAHRLLPKLSEIFVFLTVFADQFVPFFFITGATVDCLAKVRQSFVRNIELLVLGPAEVPLGFADRLLTRRVAMRFSRSGRRHSVTDRRLYGNQGRLVRDRLRISNGGVDSGEIISICNR